jgi:hypothetical protein
MAIVLDIGPSEATGNSAAPAVTLTGCANGAGVIIAIGWNSSTTLTAVDVGGQAATVIGSGYYNATLGSKIQFAYLPSLSSGGNKTVTGTLSVGTWWTIYAVSVTGHDTATFYDAENGGTGNSANPTCTVTTTVDDCAIFSYVSNGVANAAPGTGYTRVPGADGVSFGLQDFNSFEEGEYDLNVGASGAKTVDYTVGTSQWATAAAAFKPSGGGGGGGSTLWAQSLM